VNKKVIELYVMCTFSTLQPWVNHVEVTVNVLCQVTRNRRLYGVMVISVVAEQDTRETREDVVSYGLHVM
jgi:hypothetical protein